MNKLIIVSNRLPVNVTKYRNVLRFQPSIGGLATGLHSFHKEKKGLWIGWPGIALEKVSSEEREKISKKLQADNLQPVFLSKPDIENYYHGFANKTIWPLFHYFPSSTIYEKQFWKSYLQVNKLFSREVLNIAKPGDQIWIHDYHLMLLPKLLREKLPQLKIGFFLHIPFPSFEIFRLLPQRNEILDGLLAANLIGFHTQDYVYHFLNSVRRIQGAKLLGRVKVFPMGIDFQKYSQAATLLQTKREVAKIKRKLGQRKTIISIDRLDYTKGILQRLEAFDLFLAENPEYKENVTLILIAVPSRTNVESYRNLRRQLEGLIGRVNGKYGTLGWVPVWYLYRPVPFYRLIALYHLANVALVTPLRDGMNLIAKEVVATKTTGLGVLILSETAGAAKELKQSLIVNPNNKEKMAKAIKEALEMPQEEQIKRNRQMQKKLSNYTVQKWATDFLGSLGSLANL